MANIKELIQSIESPDSSFDEKLAVINEMQDTLVAMKEHEQEAIDDNVELIIEALRTIEAKVEAKLRIIPEKGEQGIQGQKGEQGDRGLDGAQGKDGKSGIDGKDGLDGKDGVSVQDAKIDFDGSLVITLSDGREINVGEVVPVDVAQTIHKIQSGSGGDSQTTLNAIAALQATIATYGTMATQNANAVAITGGTINNTTVGATTPNTGVFTTLTAQNETLKGTGQNLILQSQTYNNSTWNQSSVVRADNQTTAPDGSSTAATITSVNATYGGLLRQTPVTTASTYTMSAYVKKNNWSYVGLRLGSLNGAGDKYAYFNFDTLATSTNAISGATFTATSVGNGWYRLVLSGLIAANAGSAFDIAIVASDGSSATNNGAGQVVYVWGVQLELGSTANTYIPTTTTAVYGTPTLSFSGVASIGLQSDGSLYETSAGTGNVRFYTNNIGQEQARVSHTASAVNYVQVTGAATGSSPTISAQGSDAVVSFAIRTKGTGSNITPQFDGSVYFQNLSSQNQFRVFNTASAVNYLQTGGSTAGSGLAIQAAGSDTNIDLNLTTKGTGAVNLNTGGGTQFSVANTASATNYFATTGSNGGTPALYSAGASANIGANFVSKGTGALAFYTNGSLAQAVVAHTASAVNYVQVTGAATGVRPTISAQGSDTNIGQAYTTKGSGQHVFATNTSSIQFRVTHVGGTVVNYITTGGSAAGAAPFFAVDGTDTNIDLALTTKGTGRVKFGTYTANMALTIQGYIEIVDSGGTVRKLAVIA